jgi:hypothetical protein
VLAVIREIDRTVILKQAHYHNTATSIIHSKDSQHLCINTLNTLSSSGFSHMNLDSKAKELEELSRQIKSLLREKVVLSEQLYNRLADACE